MNSIVLFKGVYMAIQRPHFFYFLLLLTLISCTLRKNQNPKLELKTESLFTTMDSTLTNINFVNKVEDTKEFNILTYRNYYNGGGVAIGDLNKDGLADIYFTANMGKNKLFLNKGNWKFEDITDLAGVGGTRAWSTGVTMADVNGDGWLDIYVCNSGDVRGDDRENELFINLGNSTKDQPIPKFKESAKEYHLNDEGFSTHASFFDYDLDGDLDCYVLNNSFKNPEKISLNIVSRTDRDHLGGDKLFRNDGNVFTEVTHEAGIYNSKIGFGLGISVSDVNNDFLPDIYISNDFWERDYLYINRGNGTFSEELTQRIKVCSVSSMGSDIADINNDGSSEIFTTDMLPADNYRLKTMTMFDPFHLEDLKFRNSYHYQILQNSLQLNDGKGQFQEIAHLSGVGSTDWSWGALIFDFENDGWKDIFVSNGIFRDIMYLDFTNFINDQEEVKKVIQTKGQFDWRDFAGYIPSNPLANYAFKNNLSAQNGLVPTFTNKAQQLGLGVPGYSNGSAYGDLDNDGDQDLVVNNVNMAAFVYKNNATNNFLKVKLVGTTKNYFGIGAQVTIEVDTLLQVLQNYNTRGFESAVEPNLIFGVGHYKVIDRLIVTWPDKSQEILSAIPVNQSITLYQEKASMTSKNTTFKVEPLYKEVSQDILLGNVLHKENTFNDFDHERLLPKMLSTEGPKIIKGDVNGDQREDFILLGAAGDPDKLFVQDGRGHFKSSNENIFLIDKALESTCGVLFDADEDGDKDLLIGAGGNELPKGIENFVLRYYENDGHGNFSKALEKTPHAAGNFSCLLPSDFDKDGDLDLFIGGRVVPGNYGLAPRSFLFRNDKNGKWTDVIPNQSGTLGMLTDGLWSDFDKDGDDDLIVVGEWMPILILENGGNGFKGTKIVPNSMGWWTCIEANDMDQDGDPDYVIGNWGLNSKMKASPERPLHMYVNDFDKNNKSDFIISWFPPLDNTSYPFASKKDITDQLPFLKKSNLKYEEYAHKTYNLLFSDIEKKGAVVYKVDNLSTSLLINDHSNLLLQPLPLEAQISPVFGILFEDLDGDHKMDVWLGGNFYDLKPEMGRHDSSNGIFLKGNQQGKFTYLPNANSGLTTSGQVRDVASFNINNKPHVLVARNNENALLFKRM